MSRVSKPVWVLAGLGLALFILSGIFKNEDDGWRSVAGGVGWFGFLICVLGIVAIVVTGVVRGRRKPA